MRHVVSVVVALIALAAFMLLGYEVLTHIPEQAGCLVNSDCSERLEMS